jgi:hypothetical protein
MATTTFGLQLGSSETWILPAQTVAAGLVGTRGSQSFFYIVYTPVFICSCCLTYYRFLIVYSRYFHIVIL